MVKNIIISNQAKVKQKNLFFFFQCKIECHFILYMTVNSMHVLKGYCSVFQHALISLGITGIALS